MSTPTVTWRNFESDIVSRPKYKQICAEARRIGCCSRCTLRLLNVENRLVFRQSDKLVDELVTNVILNNESDSKSKSSNAAVSSSASCVMCQGILQNCDFAGMQMTDQIGLLRYQFETFTVSLSPHSTQAVFERAVWLHFQRCFPELFVGEQVDPKQIVSLTPAAKWVFGHRIEQHFGRPFQFQSSFEICVEFHHPESAEVHTALLPLVGITIKDYANPKKRRRHEGPQAASKASVAKAVNGTSISQFSSHVQVPPPSTNNRFNTTRAQPSVSCIHHAVYVAGNYNKYSRLLSQTPWVIDGVRKTADSVQELCCDELAKQFQARDYKFHTGGREDCDVRMLGKGRPFIMELLDSKRALCHQASPDWFAQQTAAINAASTDIRVTRLRPASKHDFELLKADETAKTKSYRCVCHLSRAVSDEELEQLAHITDLQIAQRTPVRVLHRRSQMVRQRTIHTIGVERINAHWVVLDLKTQAGTYVKEFIHSDRGRTSPSIGSLLECEADIIQLDVLDLHHADPEVTKRLLDSHATRTS